MRDSKRKRRKGGRERDSERGKEGGKAYEAFPSNRSKEK